MRLSKFAKEFVLESLLLIEHYFRRKASIRTLRSRGGDTARLERKVLLNPEAPDFRPDER